MFQYNPNHYKIIQTNILLSMEKLNKALIALSRNLRGVNNSINSFQVLAKDCQKYKL